MSKFMRNILKKETGMTLIEILLSLGIFAFMFLFMAQITKQNYRQVKKMSKDSRNFHSLSHIRDIMSHDFRGVSYMLDLNHNLDAKFPIEEETLSEVSLNKVPNPKSKYKKNPSLF